MHDDPISLFGIPPEDWARTPASVQLVVHSLLDIVQGQGTHIHDLQTRVKELEAKVGQSSRNSSKPPSSDPPSAAAKPPKVPRGRKAGGQPGHEGHQRPLVPPERVDETVEVRPDHCPHCQTSFPTDLSTIGDPRRTQVWELPIIQPLITEYRQYTCCCPGCRALVTAALPPEVPPGGFGSRATTWMALLRGRYRQSLDDVVELLGELCNLPVSAASIVTSCERTSAALAPVDATIQAVVQLSDQVYADETSWPTETRKGWLWVAVCAIATCFRIQQRRSGPALRHLLGDMYRGIVNSDRWTAYDQFPDGQRQLCWAHLVRNLLALLERYADETCWARHMLDLSDDLFLLWHLYKEGWIDRAALQQALIPVRLAMHERLLEGVTSPYPKIVGFCRELLEHWEALWTFSQREGVEPTNNAAERALRHAVRWRKSSFGSRSAEGCRFVERILSVHATCVQQQRSLFAFVSEAVQAAWTGQPAPILVTHPAIA